MFRYIVRRLLIAIPTVFGVTVLIFIAMRVLPGDPLAIIYGESEGTYVLTEEELAATRASLGLDQSYYMQYLNWMAQVATGDLGTSFWTKEPISGIILRRAPITIQIAFVTVVFSWLVGVPLGMLMAARRNSIIDHLSRVAVTIFIATPSYWVGLLIVPFSVLVFTWRPPISIIQLWENPIGNLTMTVLPSLAMGLGLAAGTARMARSSALGEL